MPLRISAALMLCAGVVILMGIITAEALFTGSYSTSHNQISDLGSTWNPGGIVYEPSATIFNWTQSPPTASTAAPAAGLPLADGVRIHRFLTDRSQAGPVSTQASRQSASIAADAEPGGVTHAGEQPITPTSPAIRVDAARCH